MFSATYRRRGHPRKRSRSLCVYATKDNNILRKTNCQVNIYEHRAATRAFVCARVADDTRGGPRGAPLSIRRNLLRLPGATDSGWEARQKGREKESGSRTRAHNLCSHYATTEIHYGRHALSRGFGDLDLLRGTIPMGRRCRDDQSGRSCPFDALWKSGYHPARNLQIIEIEITIEGENHKNFILEARSLHIIYFLTHIRTHTRTHAYIKCSYL